MSNAIGGIGGGSSMMMQGMGRMQHQDPAKMAESLFAKLDTSGKGYIEKADLQTAFQSVSTLSGASADDVFASLDGNSDGKVTQEELATHRAAMFAAFDANCDGLLNTEELAARELARFTETMPARTARILDRLDREVPYYDRIYLLQGRLRRLEGQEVEARLAFERQRVVLERQQIPRRERHRREPGGAVVAARLDVGGNADRVADLDFSRYLQFRFHRRHSQKYLGWLSIRRYSMRRLPS